MATVEELRQRIVKQAEYERRLDEAAARTTLPDNPDMARIEAFVERVNRFAIGG